ncbi:MAG: response regulator [Salinirussus sp.]
MHSARGGRPTVLIVEDEPSVAAAYEDSLADEFDVRRADGGQAALESVNGDVDVILLDRNMPDVHGDKVVKTLREEGSDIPVAMVTGVEPDSDIIDLPVDEYLTKPVSAEVLQRTVEVLANRSTFTRKSREFFQLAAKEASLKSAGGNESTTKALHDRLADLRAELDETLTILERPDDGLGPGQELDTDEVEDLLSSVQEHALPDEIRELVDDYQSLDAARPPFMWKWVHRLAPQNTLPCVEPRFRDAVPVDKTIAILFITLLDDVLEKLDDRATFAELRKIPEVADSADPDRNDVDGEYVEFAIRVWQTLVDRIQRGPHYDSYERLFRFDIRQAISAIDYADLAIHQPEVATVGDLERYESHNMVMFAYADIDLMHSDAEFGDQHPELRDAIWTAQLMARIGNWVSTWERELREGDFSSGPVVRAVEQGVVTSKDLEVARTDSTAATEAVDAIKAAGIEKEFLAEWERSYADLRRHNDRIEGLDLTPYIEGLEEVLRYHLASTGLK